MLRQNIIRLLALGGAVALVVPACSSDDDGDPIALMEWSIGADATYPAGEVTFDAQNDGAEVHEVVIVKGDDPSALPTDEDGAVIESEIEDDIVGEIEDVDPDASKSATFDLDAGSYILFCNITETDEGETESHFAEGMVTTITVE